MFLLLGPKIIPGTEIQQGEQHLIFGWQALGPIISNHNLMDRLRECRMREEVFDLIVAANPETPGAVRTD